MAPHASPCGSRAMMGRRRRAIAAKVLDRVSMPHGFCGCWEWQGPTSGDGRGGGYGRMSLDGQTVAVHLVMFCNWFGFIPGKKQVDHVCENRLCCNPMHLELVTHLENQRRKTRRALRDAARVNKYGAKE